MRPFWEAGQHQRRRLSRGKRIATGSFVDFDRQALAFPVPHRVATTLGQRKRFAAKFQACNSSCQWSLGSGSDSSGKIGLPSPHCNHCWARSFAGSFDVSCPEYSNGRQHAQRSIVVRIASQVAPEIALTRAHTGVDARSNSSDTSGISSTARHRFTSICVSRTSCFGQPCVASTCNITHKVD